MELIDTHAHLAMLEHAPIEDILKRAQESHIKKMVTVSTDVPSWTSNQNIADKHENIFFTLGMHPHDAVDWEANQLNLSTHYQSLINKEKCVAIGECGLDYYYEHSPKEVQIACFEAQVKLAQDWDLPLVIHCREAFPDLFAALNKIGVPNRRGVMHCFTGTTEEALESVKLGFFISFSGILTFKNSEALRATAKAVPMEKIVIETDCPFLAPVPNRGKKNEPAFLEHTARVLAQLKVLDLSEVARITTQNAHTLFQI